MELEMVVEEYQMIDIINTYLNSITFKPIILGGMIGTSLFEHVFNACMEQFPYERICIIEGIQDYIGMKKQNTNYLNHFFYAEGYINKTIMNNEFPFSLDSYMYNHKDYIKEPKLLFERLLYSYDVFIINDAHLIPEEYLIQLKNLRKKMFILVDPFDINGERYYNVPTIIDSLKRLPILVARARALYNVETRAYDKNAQSSFNTIKVSKRSIGKLGDTMYVTNDKNIIEYARNKQLVAPSKKNHRMMVMDTYVARSLQLTSDQHAVVSKYSMIQVIQQHRTKGIYNFRIYASNNTLINTMSYDMNNPKVGLHVIPANILTPEQVAHHRFKNVVYVHGSCEPSVREMYTLMKCTRNLSTD